MASLLNSQSKPSGAKSALRSGSLNPQKSLSSKMSTSLKNSFTPHNNKGGNLDGESKTFNQIGKKSQLTLGLSKNTMKGATKRTLIKSNNKRKRLKNTRLPSIQASRKKNNNEDLV